MSTRVQKGGTVFRPVTKSRPRGAENVPQQPSAVVEPQASFTSSTSSDAPHPSSSTQTNTPVTLSSAVPSFAVPVRTSAVPAPNQGYAIPGPSFTPIIMPSTGAPPRAQFTPNPQSTQQLTTEAPGSQIQSGDTNDEPPSSKRRRKQQSRASSADSRRTRNKGRGASTPAFDPNADPGEELDPTAITMATLCDDTGQGRISSKASQILDNHAAWKKSNREKRARMKAMMEAKKYGRDDENDALSQPGASAQANSDSNTIPGQSDASGSATTATTDQANNDAEDTTGSGFDYSQNLTTSQYSVQVRIGPNGETIIDEESLFVDRNGENDTADYTHVEESDVTKFINSGTYGKRYRGSRWTAEETELFYDALSQFGENYELISYVLPGRDRKSCKNKFKAEDKKNSNRITHCLNNRVPYDIQTLARMTGKDFSGPTPEIRAPTVLTLAEPQEQIPEQSGGQPSDMTKKQSDTPGIIEDEDEEEILGDISSYL